MMLNNLFSMARTGQGFILSTVSDVPASEVTHELDLQTPPSGSHRSGIALTEITTTPAILSYCAIELPTEENIFVELDPMIRTVTTTSRTMIANIRAYSATS
jgi:hypothetical protein